MKVDGSLKSLLQGVSQQPPRDRLPGQCTAMINMSADPVTGLTRRPPTDLVGKLMTASDVRGWHDFQSRNGAKFLAAFRTSGVNAWDRNATAKSVTMTAPATYIGASGVLRNGTVEDSTYVANRNQTVSLLSTTKVYFNLPSATQSPSGIIQVLGGAYGRTYSILLNGVTIVSYTPPNGSAAVDLQYVRTSKIASILAYGLKNAVAAGSGWGGGLRDEAFSSTAALAGANWTVTLATDIILITNNVFTSFQLTSADDQGSLAMKTMTETVADTSDLPAFAPAGYLVRVAKETDPNADLFLAFFRDDGVTTLGSGFGNKGYWQEVVASGTKYAFDQTTMPHVLEYRSSTDDFEWHTGGWADREVGTTVSNPDPSFVGNTINDISTFQSRLVFLSGSNVIMSRTKKKNNFWFESTAANADTDPIDISSTAVEASRMLAAVPHNRDLVVFSEEGQFIAFGRTALTPQNSALALTTAFEADLTAKPSPAGRNVFFASKYGDFSTMREFYAEGNSDINDSRPITSHVTKFIKGVATKLSSSSNYNMLIVQTDDDQSIVYPYQFIWSDTDKVQSAWSLWDFPRDIVHTFFDEELIYYVVRVPTVTPGTYDYYLYRQSLNVVPDAAMDYTTFLDERFDVFSVDTQFLLPFDYLADPDDLVIVQSTGCPYPGILAPIKTLEYSVPDSAWKVTVKYDLNGGDVICGTRFMSYYRPTMPFVKDSDNVVIGTGKLIIKAFKVALQKTGYIAGQMVSKYGDGSVVEFSGRIIGDVGNVVGQQPLSDDEFLLPYRGDNRYAEATFFTDSHLPMTLLDVEWVGQYNKRGRRLGGGGG